MNSTGKQVIFEIRGCAFVCQRRISSADSRCNTTKSKQGANERCSMP